MLLVGGFSWFSVAFGNMRKYLLLKTWPDNIMSSVFCSYDNQSSKDSIEDVKRKQGQV
jgi:hypothetical protein